MGYQLLGLIGSMLIGILLTLLCSTVVIAIFFPTLSLATVQNATNFADPNVLNAMRCLIAIQTIFFFGVSALLYAYIATTKWAKYLGLTTSIKPIALVFVGIAVMVASLPLVSFLTQVNLQLPMAATLVGEETKLANLTAALLQMNSFIDFITTLFVVAFLPALCEELIFRGCMQQVITNVVGKQNVISAIFITAIIFAMLHGQFQTLLPRVLLGYVLGLLFYYSKSIWPGVIAHFINNGAQVALIYFGVNNVSEITNMKQQPPTPIWQAALSLIAIGGCIWVYVKLAKAKNNTTSTLR